MKRRILFAYALILCCACLVAAQQGPKPMQVEDLFKVRAVGGPEVSPDGSTVLFTVSENDWESNGTITHIWRVATAGGAPVQLTRGEKSCGSPRWSLDGKTIAFSTSRSGDAQVWFMRADGGEPWQVTKHKGGIGSYEFSTDGKSLLFLATDAKTASEEKREKEKNSVRLYENDQRPNHLWTWDIATGAENRLTSGDFSIRQFVQSPSGDAVAMITAPSPRVDDNLKVEIQLLNRADNSLKRLTENAITEGGLNWSPDGASITFVSDSSADLVTYHQRSIFLIDRSGSRPVDLLPDFAKEVGGHTWITLDGAPKILFTANMGVNTHVFLYDVQKRAIERTVADGVGDHGLGKFTSAGWVTTFTDPTHPNDIWFRKTFDSEPVRLTDMNPQVRDMSLATYRTITWKASDGKDVEGILILPPDYTEGKRYPLIVQLHGGPESSYTNDFSVSWADYPHVLAGKGYVLFQPNYRGSTGYGDDVMRAIIGRYFEQDVDDILTGIDWLIAQGIADPDKIGAHGWSAGGHLSNWFEVRHSDRFKVICSGAGVANWASFYAQTDMHYIREIWMTGPPYEREELFRAKSPITYVKDAKTPILIFCGEADQRVPAAQSIELFVGLKRYGVTTELRLYPGEPHGPRKLSHRKDKIDNEIIWFDRYLLGIEPKAEEPVTEEKK